MEIVVITSSPHPKNESTSIYRADRFTEGAKSAGHEVFTFDAANEETHPCRGCDKCGMDGPCIFQDAIETKLMPKMLEADMLVLTTPLYYYGMTSQLKTVIDRFCSSNSSITNKGLRSVLIAVAWNADSWTFDALEAHYETLVRYLHLKDCGRLLGYGCGTPAMTKRSRFMKEAYALGQSL